jgi:spore germination cell wall hydrolase CwlJ-like protein
MRLASCWLVLGLGVAAFWTPTPANAQTKEYQSLECLALNIYWEARSETARDQRAVGHVTLNRKASPDFPNTICEVVHQGGEDTLYGCQVHWWCDGQLDEPQNPIAWQEALHIARRVLSGDDPDPTDGALFFHNANVEPEWASARLRTVQIGPHIFYR